MDNDSYKNNAHLTRRSLVGFALAAVFVAQPVVAEARGWRHRKLAGHAAIPAKPNTGSIDTSHVEAIINETCGCSTVCTQTARDVVAAADLWMQVMKKQNVTVPDYIDVGYAIRCAGIESVMDPLNHAPGSEYSGLMQYARLDHRKTFWSVADQLVTYFNNPDVRSRVQLTTDPKGVRLADFREEKIFLNPQVQVAALMFSALKLSKQIDDTPLMGKLPPEYKQSWLYLYHNLPKMAWIVRDNIDADIPVCRLAPRSFARFYRANSGIYGRYGTTTPLGVLARINKLTQLFYDRFDPNGSQFPANPPAAKPAPVRLASNAPV